MTNQTPTQVQLALTKKELYGLYLILKKQELKLEDTMYGFLIKLEKLLYATMTIEEMEDLKGQLKGQYETR